MSDRAPKQQMIAGLLSLQTQVTPIHKNLSSSSKLINCKNQLPTGFPSERCPAVYDLWCMIYLLGLSWVAAGSVKEEIWVWGDLGLKKEIAKLIPLTIFWIIWKERNLRPFERIEVGTYSFWDKWFNFLDLLCWVMTSLEMRIFGMLLMP